MLKEQESKWNMDGLTDAEIYAAIRYLDPGSVGDRSGQSKSATLATCVSMIILLIGCIAFIWLYVSIS